MFMLITMHATLLASALLVFTTLQISGVNSILHGSAAEPTQFPWQVAVFRGQMIGTGPKYLCSGVLISETQVLTSPDCVSEVGSGGQDHVYMQYGAVTLFSDEESRVTFATRHRGAWPDVGFFLIPNGPIFNEYIQAIRLPEVGETVPVGAKVYVSGWGATETVTDVSNTVNWVEVTTISNEQCSRVFGTNVTEKTLCTIGAPDHGPCGYGDRGSPLVYLNDDGVPTLHGIANFWHESGCNSGFPVGYIRVEAILDTIAQIPERPS